MPAPARRRPRLAVLLALLGVLVGGACHPERASEAGCAQSLDALGGLGTPGTRGIGTRPNAEFVEVQVYYGTNRARTASCEPAAFFGAERAPLSYGRVLVTVPRDHRLGNLESPSIWRLELDASPAKHVVLRSVTPLEPGYFEGALEDALARSAEPSALVFVHGYNIRFEEAARRTAQIAYDLKFPGVPLFFSWPSRGLVTDYIADRDVARASVPDIARFLAEVAERAGPGTLHLIAHSVGSEVLAGAISELVARPGPAPHFGEIVLAAPDMDARSFRSHYADVLTRAATRVTLYASARDRALQAARDLLQFPRVGDPSDGILIEDRIETVDATDVDTSFVGHSYYGENRSVIADLFNLLRERQPASHRFGLEPVQTADGTYWRFRP